jgi:8-oxo-dGTP pyrophosphatase MutT (NUDIX family)
MIATYDELTARFRQPLPGPSAHLLMYPRKGATPESPDDSDNVRMSAVAIILFEEDETLRSIVIQRSVYEGTHSGQIAFPGGKWETTDSSLKETALRECSEEVGIGADELEYIGKLTDVFTVVSSFLIEPYVFYWRTPRSPLSLSEREVAAVYTIDMSALLDDQSIHYIDVPLRNGLTLKEVPHFVLGDIRIWGATALMLSELKLVLKSI